MKKLLKDTLRVSTTNMEKYNSCAFAYFLNYSIFFRFSEKERPCGASAGPKRNINISRGALPKPSAR